MTTDQANRVAFDVLWRTYRTAGLFGGLDAFDAGMVHGAMVIIDVDLGAEPWVMLSVLNQIRMLPRKW